MKLFVEGEKSRAICPTCNAIRATTLVERDIPLSSGRATVRDVLVAVCDDCNGIVSIPQQSAPRIKEAMPSERAPLEARVPRHFLDAMALACDELGFSPNCAPLLFRFYVHRSTEDKKTLASIVRLATLADKEARATARFSAKLNASGRSEFAALKVKTKLTDAKLVRGMILQVKKDILDTKNVKIRKEVRGVLALAE